jgi:hypothetical protein
MAQVVSRRPLTAKAQVCARITPFGICGGQSGTEAGFYSSDWFSPVSIIPPWVSMLSMLVYYLGDEQ